MSAGSSSRRRRLPLRWSGAISPSPALAFPSLDGAPAWPRFGAFSHELRAGEWQRLIDRWHAAGLECVQLAGGLLADCVEAAIEPGRSRRCSTWPGSASAGSPATETSSRPSRRSGANLDLIRACVELASALGTSVVATETGTRSLEGDWPIRPPAGARRPGTSSVEALETLLPIAERSGSVLALEGYVGNVLKTPGQLLALLERFPLRHLQVVLDPYNYLSRHLLPARER